MHDTFLGIIDSNTSPDIPTLMSNYFGFITFCKKGCKFLDLGNLFSKRFMNNYH